MHANVVIKFPISACETFFFWRLRVSDLSVVEELRFSSALGRAFKSPPVEVERSGTGTVKRVSCER
jgi:hypothetical protein